MNANEMTFGVEIETTAPDTAIESDGLRIGAYHHGIPVPYLPTGWKAERDGSIDCSRGGQPCEIVSPVLKRAEGIAPVARSSRPPNAADGPRQPATARRGPTSRWGSWGPLSESSKTTGTRRP